jgi:hypothetical protein
MPTPNEHTALAAALSARNAAREILAAATAALERASTAADEASRAADRLIAEEDGWISRHARKLQAWIEAGQHGSAPTLVADAGNLQKKLTAQAHARAAAAAAEALAAAESAERQELQRCEHQVNALKLQARRNRVEATLARLDELWAEELTLFALLAASDPANTNRVLSPRAQELLMSPGHRPSAAALFPSGHVRTDINSSPLGQVAALDAAAAEWARFDAELEELAAAPPPAQRAA